MTTQSMAKRRHFGSFRLALLHNLQPSLVYRALKHGFLISHSTKVHQFHNWLLTSEGTSLPTFDTGMECRLQPVSSMTACDIAASSYSGTPVHVGAHPMLTRVVHLWAGHRRWRPLRKKTRQLISRRRYMEGARLLKARVAKADFT